MKGIYGFLIIILASLVSLFVYWPALSSIFGLHNDYSLLASIPGNVLGFIESRHLVTIGRLLGGVAVGLQGWTTQSVADFTVWRWVGWWASMLNAVLMVRFLGTIIPLGRWWRLMLFLMFMTIPAIVVQILWTVHVLPGAVNSTIAVLSYLVFYKACRSNKGMIRNVMYAGAFVLLWISLWVYYPTASIFLVFTAFQLLFKGELNRQQLRDLVMRDLIFFGGAVVFYFVVDRFFLVYLEQMRWFIPIAIDPSYQVGVTNNWFNKFPMLWDSFVLSYKGIWNFLGTTISNYFIIIEAVIVIVCWKSMAALRQERSLLIEKIAWIFLLLLVTQLPMIASVGIDYVKGYRVLVASTLIITVVKFYFLTGAGRGGMGKLKELLLITMVLLMCATCFSKIKHVVTVRKAELLNLYSGVSRLIHLPQINTVIIIPALQKMDLIEGRLSSELEYMITLRQHWQPAIVSLCRQWEGIQPRKNNLTYRQLPVGFQGMESADIITIDLGEFDFKKVK